MTNAERNARIVEMVRQREKTLDEIGASFGITRERARQIAAKAGAVRGYAGRIGAIPSDKKARAVELYQKGMPIAHIAADLGHSSNPIAALLVKAGLHTRNDPTTPWNDAETEYLRRAYGKVKASLLAKQFGRTRNEIIGKAHRLGLRACEAPRSTAQPAHEMVAT